MVVLGGAAVSYEQGNRGRINLEVLSVEVDVEWLLFREGRP